MPLQKRPFQLAKMPKYAILTLIFEKFSGGPHTGERAPDPIPRGHLDYQVLRAPQYLNPAL